MTFLRLKTLLLNTLFSLDSPLKTMIASEARFVGGDALRMSLAALNMIFLMKQKRRSVQ